MNSESREIWTDAVAELGFEHVKDAIPELTAFLETKTNPRDRINVARALAQLGDERGAQILRTYCNDQSLSLNDRLGAAQSLLQFQPNCCAPTLIQGLKSDDVRLTAIGMITFFKQLSPEEWAEVRTLLLKSLEDKDQMTRLAAADVMFGLKDPTLLPPLQAALNKETVPFVRQAMEQSLKHMQTVQP
jgi:HEAT repeat protein